MLKKRLFIFFGVMMVCSCLCAQFNRLKIHKDNLEGPNKNNQESSTKSIDSSDIQFHKEYNKLSDQLHELKQENLHLKQQMVSLKIEFEHLKQVIALKGIFQKDSFAIPKIEVVKIVSDTFTIGSPLGELNRGYDEVQYKVSLNTFKISKFEITNAQYAQFLNSMHVGSDGINKLGEYPGKVLIYPNIGWGLVFLEFKWFPVKGYENHPVVNVTWYGADEFAKFVGGRLPTEAEWEYACRSKTNTSFNTGNCLSDNQANFDWTHHYQQCSITSKTKTTKTRPVGSYAPNEFGLYDMHGNANEWCNDWYGEYDTSSQKNPQGPTLGMERIIRGGGWDGSAWHCRSASRFSNAANYENDGLGFRVVFLK